jgi:anti-sigma regulatory factor (Ser/Thr protein kinase)
VEALLADEWLRGVDATIVHDEASLTLVRARVREAGALGGVASDVVDRACLVATEIGTNHLRHAVGGRIAVRAITRDEHRGLEILGVDRGPGLRDLAAALDAWPRAGAESLGVGVGSIRRMSTEVDFDVRLGEGTRILARLFPLEAPREREIGIYGRAIPGEAVSGDHASFHRVGERIVLAVCDGLGHGPAAREAAALAIRAFDEHASSPFSAIFDECHAALGASRGAVMALACITAGAPPVLETAAVGNVEVQVCAPRTAKRIGASSAVLGSRSAAPKPRTERVVLAKDALVVMATDGISSKLAIEEDLALLREHPGVVAQRIVERFARTNDDALVLVARSR